MTALPLGLLQSAADKYGGDFTAKAEALSQYPLDSITSQIVSRDNLSQEMAIEARAESLQYMLLASVSDGRTAPPPWLIYFGTASY